MKNGEFHAYTTTPMNELSDRDVEVWRGACENLLSAFLILALRYNFLKSRSSNVYVAQA